MRNSIGKADQSMTLEAFGRAGEEDFKDFWFNDVLFPHPAQQLADYQERFGVRFGGIRKPVGFSTSTVL